MAWPRGTGPVLATNPIVKGQVKQEDEAPCADGRPREPPESGKKG